ncbi:hypothetical protein ACQY0O_005725 [Thecaphora frezii]
MASQAVSAAPSQFSRLLRQSRIASFDPAIPQVYSTPPAYAARGDWGLKRPLPSSSNSALPSSSSSGSGVANHPGALRYVEVQQLDTPEGQTTWKEREKETLFVKRWAETDARLLAERDESHNNYTPGSQGPRPQTRYLSSTERYFPSEIPGPIELAEPAAANETPAERDARLYNNRWRAMQRHYAARGAADPTYKGLDFMGEQSHSRAFGFDADKFTTRPRMMPNYNALSDKQFDRFVEQIRASRPEWKAYFRNKERSRLLGAIRRKQEKAYAVALEAQRDAERRGATLEALPKVDPEAELAKMKPVEVDLLEQSRDLDATRDAFRMLEDKTLNATTRACNEQLPGTSQPTTMHPHAGLQYSQPDPIFTTKLAEPLPGRVLHEVTARHSMRTKQQPTFGRNADGRSVLIGGHAAYLSATSRKETPQTIDWSRQDPKQGTALFRIVKAYRTSKITLGSGMHRDMLTPRSDLGYVHSDVAVVKRDVDAPRTMTDEPIGSPAYVGKALEDPSKPALRAIGGGAGFDASRKAPRPLGGFYSPKKLMKLGRSARTSDADETRQMLANLDSLISKEPAAKK